MTKKMTKIITAVLTSAMLAGFLPQGAAKAAEKQEIRLVSDTAGGTMEDGTITYPGGTISSSTCVQFTLNKKSSVRLDQEFKMLRALNPWYYDPDHPEEHIYRDSAYQLKAVLSTDEEGRNVVCAYDDETGSYFLPLSDKQTLEAGTYYYTISWSPAEEDTEDWSAISLNDVRFYWETYGWDYQGYIKLSLEVSDQVQEAPSHTAAPYIGNPTQEDLEILQEKKAGNGSAAAAEYKTTGYKSTEVKSAEDEEQEEEDTVEDNEKEETKKYTQLQWKKVKKASRYIVKTNNGKKWITVKKTKATSFAYAKTGRKYRIEAQKKVKGRYKTIQKMYLTAD